MRRVGKVWLLAACVVAAGLSGIVLVPGNAVGGTTGCVASDGDTLRCGEERIRLLGIDTPELRGHCRKGRRCVPGDPIAAKHSLERAIAGPLAIERHGRDRYGRTLAIVTGPLGELSCRQLAEGHARYRADWDAGRRVARRCPEQARRAARQPRRTPL